MDLIIQFFIDFWQAVVVMAPYLLFGFLIAGLLHVLLPTHLVRSQLGSSGMGPVVKASLFGVPIPLCSCGVIPVSMSLRQSGASVPAVVSFLISTPQTGVDSILVTWGMMGPVFAVYRPIVAFVTGVISGFLTKFTAESDVSEKQPDNEQADCCKEDNNKAGAKNNNTQKNSKFSRMFRHGFVTLPRDIGTSMLIGLMIAALLSLVVPEDFFAEYLPSGILAMVIMLFLGVPVYVCSAASVPVAAALVSKGLTAGAAMVFLMTGPATNTVTLVTIWNRLGRRTAIAYIATVVFSALAAGLLLDTFLPGLSISIQQQMKPMESTLLDQVWAVLLVVILVSGIILKTRRATAEKKSSRQVENNTGG